MTKCSFIQLKKCSLTKDCKKTKYKLSHKLTLCSLKLDVSIL